jgi:endo-1,4-beta-xylanase
MTRQPKRHGNIAVGTAVRLPALSSDHGYAVAVATQFNMITPENEMKWEAIHPQPNIYDFGPGDTIVRFARAHRLRVRGHNLAWYLQNPPWLTAGSFTRDQLIALLREHISTVVGHYRGQIAQWDVVNEAIDDQGGLRHNVWLDGIGPEYIPMAFEFAHRADRHALLFYNDYGSEGLGPKSDAIYQLVAQLKRRRVPIAGVGLQLHTSTLPPLRPNAGDVATNTRRLGASGLKVAITEMDVRLALPTTPDALAQQAQVYREMLATCLAASNCTAFVVWGFTDRYSWIGGPFVPGQGGATLFDTALHPKPAYLALAQLLDAGTRGLKNGPRLRQPRRHRS